MNARRRREPVELVIESLSHEGRGVARNDGKTVFVHGALPGERVMARILRKRGRFDEAEALEILEASPQRIEPHCAHFGVCGGCALQHLGEADQLAHKQSVLVELLEHPHGLRAKQVRAPVRGPQWGYRRKARLGVKRVVKKGGVIVGFRERASPYVTDCHQCDTLDPRVGGILPQLRSLVDGLSVAARVPQFEIACSDERVVLIMRHLEPLDHSDRAALAAFAEAHGVELWVQSGGLDTVRPLAGEDRDLRYVVADCELTFTPVDFTQVNDVINRQMVALALDRLALEDTDRILDLFCGLGNFTLPLARHAAHVAGFEGDATLIERARANAALNGLSNCRFEVADLADEVYLRTLVTTGVNKLLVDPPRSGARAVFENLPLDGIERLVYVSCNPVTFARDAAMLCGQHGFTLAETGILDMFPQTAHVESLSLFVR